VVSARRQGEWAHRLVCPCLKINEKLSALHYSDFRAGVMGIEYGYGVRCRPDSGLPSAKGRSSWQPVRVRNAHIRFVRVRSLRRSIAARSARRWKKPRMWIANALIRLARAERNTRPTLDQQRCAPLYHPEALLRLGCALTSSWPAGRIARRSLRNERAAAAPHGTPDQSFRDGGNDVRTCFRNEGKASVPVGHEDLSKSVLSYRTSKFDHAILRIAW
jgi:hypothetical protein